MAPTLFHQYVNSGRCSSASRQDIAHRYLDGNRSLGFVHKHPTKYPIALISIPFIRYEVRTITPDTEIHEVTSIIAVSYSLPYPLYYSVTSRTIEQKCKPPLLHCSNIIYGLLSHQNARRYLYPSLHIMHRSCLCFSASTPGSLCAYTFGRKPLVLNIVLHR